jgi:hypothetical protein
LGLNHFKEKNNIYAISMETGFFLPVSLRKRCGSLLLCSLQSTSVLSDFEVGLKKNSFVKFLVGMGGVYDITHVLSSNYWQHPDRENRI